MSAVLGIQRVGTYEPAIYIGSRPPAWFIGSNDWAWLKIGLVVCLEGRVTYRMTGVSPLMQWPMLDVSEPAFVPERPHFERWIAAVKSVAGSRPVFWHSEHGLNRSAFAVVSYLCAHHGADVYEAIAEVRAVRGSCALSNRALESALIERYG